MMLAPAWPDERDGCDPFRQRSLLTSSTASIASQRTVELAVPRYDIRKQFYSPRTTLPPLTYGGEGRLNEGRLSDPTHVGDLIMARSVEPGMVDRPVVLTSPRLSPRYRVPAGWAGIGQPAFVPPSSSRLTGIISPRTARLAALEEIPGKKVYDAVARGDMEHLSVLVKDKATDLNFSGQTFSESPLNAAVKKGHLGAVSVLLGAGAQVNNTDKFGSTALHIACRWEHVPIVKMLLASHADPYTVNKQGFTPLDYAMQGSPLNQKIIGLLEARMSERVGVERRDAVLPQLQRHLMSVTLGQLASEKRGFQSWIASKDAVAVLDVWQATLVSTVSASPEGLAANFRTHFLQYQPPADLAGWLLGLAMLAETLPISLTVSDCDIAGFPLVFVNNKFVEVTGYTKAECYGRNCRFLQGPATNAAHGAKLRDDLRDGSVSQTMLLNYRKNGETFDNLLTMRLIHDSVGRRRFCVGLQLDLTGLSSDEGPWGQRRLASQSGRELIAESSKKMLALVSVLPSVVEVPAVGTGAAEGDATEAEAGVPEAQASEAGVPEAQASAAQASESVDIPAELSPNAEPFPSADRESPPAGAQPPIPVPTNVQAATPAPDSRPSDPALLALARALGVQPLGDQALRRDWPSQFAHLADQLHVAVCVVDMTVAGLPMMYVNTAFAQMTGYARDELIGRNCRLLQGEQTEAAELARLIEAIRVGVPVGMHLTNYRKDGAPFVNDVSLHPVFTEDGLYRYNVGVLWDLTAVASWRQLQEEAVQEEIQVAEGTSQGGMDGGADKGLEQEGAEQTVVEGEATHGEEGRAAAGGEEATAAEADKAAERVAAEADEAAAQAEMEAVLAEAATEAAAVAKANEFLETQLQTLRLHLPRSLLSALQPASPSPYGYVDPVAQMQHFYPGSSKLVRLLWSTDPDGALCRLLALPASMYHPAIASLGQYLSSEAVRAKLPRDEGLLQAIVIVHEWHMHAKQPPIGLVRQLCARHLKKKLADLGKPFL